MKKKKLGLIINPIAGMGGSVGLKGTDNVVQIAATRGAIPRANDRSKTALKCISDLRNDIEIYTYPGEMGGRLAQEMGFKCVLFPLEKKETDRNDTTNLAITLLEEKVDLILFAGGDGTARDIYRAIGDQITCLGIPAGVKIYSPVYGKNPQSAGELARRYLEGKISKWEDAEVLDLDEDLYRQGQVFPQLFGYLRIPMERRYLQSRKAGTPLSEQASIESIAHEVVENMEEKVYYLIGAGTTTKGIMDMLHLKNTLVGIDLICDKKLIANDIYGSQIVDRILGKKVKLIVSVTGVQGFLFGRGNQQLTPEVLRIVGKENIIIVATKDKLFQLRGNPLLVDTSDPELDRGLSGHYKVITSYHESILCKIST